MLERYGEKLLGSTIEEIWRFAAVSEAGPIRLLNTLVFGTAQGFVTLTRTQEGLSCELFGSAEELRWSSDLELSFGSGGSVEEWLDLTKLDDDEKVPDLPLRVTRMAGWFGVGAYEDVFALALSGASTQLILMPTDCGDLVCRELPEALTYAETAAENMNMRLVREDLP